VGPRADLDAVAKRKTPSAVEYYKIRQYRGRRSEFSLKIFYIFMLVFENELHYSKMQYKSSCSINKNIY
jgi:hypothetical protein